MYEVLGTDYLYVLLSIFISIKIVPSEKKEGKIKNKNHRRNQSPRSKQNDNSSIAKSIEFKVNFLFYTFSVKLAR